MSVAPITSINVIDGVLGTWFSLLAISAMARRYGATVWMANLAAVAVLVMDPFFVNTSANALGTALFITLFAAAGEIGSRRDQPPRWQLGALVGLLYAALAALKTSLGFLAALHFAALVCSVLLWLPRKAHVAGWLLQSAAFAGLLVSPWVLLHRSKYFEFIERMSLRQDRGSFSPGAAWEHFSTAPLFYGHGTTNIHYTLFTMCVAALAMIVTLRNRQNPTALVFVVLQAGVTLTAGYVLFAVILAPSWAGGAAALRYIGPLFPAAIVVLVGFAIPRIIPGLQKDWKGAAMRLLPLVAVIIAFSPSLAGRIRQARGMGSCLAIPTLATEAYAKLCQSMLGPAGEAMAKKAQQSVPVDAGLLLWSHFSFQFDFERNRIFDADWAGLAGRWHDWQGTESFEQQFASLAARGVEYIVWQYQGPGVRTTAQLLAQDYPARMRFNERVLRANRFLRDLGANPDLSEIVYEDGIHRVLRLKVSGKLPEPAAEVE